MSEITWGLAVGVAYLLGVYSRHKEVGALKAMLATSVSQGDRLFSVLEGRQDHTQRLERVDRGLAETSKPPKKVDPMPADIFHMTRLFAHGGGQLRSAAMKMRAEGAQWESVREYLREEIESQAPGVLDKVGISPDG